MGALVGPAAGDGNNFGGSGRRGGIGAGGKLRERRGAGRLIEQERALKIREELADNFHGLPGAECAVSHDALEALGEGLRKRPAKHTFARGGNFVTMWPFLAEARMARRSRREYWQGVLARQAGSGLSIKSFCERERLSYQSYFLWKRKFRDEPGPAEKAMTFAPVTVVPQASAGAGGLEIVLPGDRRVMVHAPVDRQALADVLAVLGAGEARALGAAC